MATDILIRIDEETGAATTLVDGVKVGSHGDLMGALRGLLCHVEAPEAPNPRGQREIVRGVARREAEQATRENGPPDYLVKLVSMANDLAAEHPGRVTRERRRDLRRSLLDESVPHEAPYSFAALSRPMADGSVVALRGRFGEISRWNASQLMDLIARLSREDA